jgi:hypothetical protein
MHSNDVRHMRRDIMIKRAISLLCKIRTRFRGAVLTEELNKRKTDSTADGGNKGVRRKHSIEIRLVVSVS